MSGSVLTRQLQGPQLAAVSYDRRKTQPAAEAAGDVADEAKGTDQVYEQPEGPDMGSLAKG